MKQIVYRQIEYYEGYYLNFFNSLPKNVQLKFNWTLQLIATVERVPSKFMRYIVGSKGIYEIRVEVGGDIFRVFAFFERDKLIILLNGFQKKTEKTPKKEIDYAIRIRNEYLTNLIK